MGQFSDRKAPYAPISALERFLDRIRDRSAPEVVDHKFLAKLNVASNNEYALLSALKFLGIVDTRGRPTLHYRSLQIAEGFQETLMLLVAQAYQPALAIGVENMSSDELIDYFKRESSPSQARNAARFFKGAYRLGGGQATKPVLGARQVEMVTRPPPKARNDMMLDIKARLLEKLPPPLPSWSAAEYQNICESFLAILENLDRTE